jgi:hypothetical protein
MPQYTPTQQNLKKNYIYIFLSLFKCDPWRTAMCKLQEDSGVVCTSWLKFTNYQRV